MHGAIAKGLARRGFTRSAEAPDLFVHYHATIDPWIEDTNGIDSPERLEFYQRGTLLIDVTDARTGRLIWRGWAQDAMDDAVVNRGRMARLVEQSVTRMLDRLPTTIARQLN